MNIIKGYKFSGISCGIKKSKELDLGMIFSEKEALCVAAFTKNLLKSNSIIVSQKHLNRTKKIKCIITNSGCANTACGKNAVKMTEKICNIFAKKLNIKKEEILIASTGVIGEDLPFDKIVQNSELVISSLKNDKRSLINFAKSIMTTDTKYKLVSKKIKIRNKIGTILCIAKGAGMISPDLELYKPRHATMLVFLLTDVKLSYNMMNSIMNNIILPNFNSFSIDGDTSPNDTIFFVSNSIAVNESLNDEEFVRVSKLINTVCEKIIQKLLFDGEGVTKVVKIVIKNCQIEDAKKIAKSVANSLLVKTAIHGADPNWGRILTACGYSGVDFNTKKTNIWIENYQVVKNGTSNNVQDDLVRKIMKKNFYQITIDISKKRNTKPFVYYTTDISKKYIEINSQYKT